MNNKLMLVRITNRFKGNVIFQGVIQFKNLQKKLSFELNCNEVVYTTIHIITNTNDLNDKNIKNDIADLITRDDMIAIDYTCNDVRFNELLTFCTW